MALSDALLAHCDATVAIIDRRHAPSGHWIDAYPFGRPHQPSAFYGVSSAPLVLARPAAAAAAQPVAPSPGGHEMSLGDRLQPAGAPQLDRSAAELGIA